MGKFNDNFYITNVDIMIDGYWKCDIKKHIFSKKKGANNMIEKLFKHILAEKPYLQRVEEFTAVWNDNHGEEAKITFRPARQTSI